LSSCGGEEGAARYDRGRFGLPQEKGGKGGWIPVFYGGERIEKDDLNSIMGRGWVGEEITGGMEKDEYLLLLTTTRRRGLEKAELIKRIGRWLPLLT